MTHTTSGLRDHCGQVEKKNVRLRPEVKKSVKCYLLEEHSHGKHDLPEAEVKLDKIEPVKI